MGRAQQQKREASSRAEEGEQRTKTLSELRASLSSEPAHFNLQPPTSINQILIKMLLHIPSSSSTAIHCIHSHWFSFYSYNSVPFHPIPCISFQFAFPFHSLILLSIPVQSWHFISFDWFLLSIFVFSIQFYLGALIYCVFHLFLAYDQFHYYLTIFFLLTFLIISFPFLPMTSFSFPSFYFQLYAAFTWLIAECSSSRFSSVVILVVLTLVVETTEVLGAAAATLVEVIV